MINMETPWFLLKDDLIKDYQLAVQTDDTDKANYIYKILMNMDAMDGTRSFFNFITSQKDKSHVVD